MTKKGTTQTWFITGATSGIGRELTAAALARGDRVAAIARRVDALSDLSERFGDALLSLAADVRDEQSVRQAVDQAVRRFGSIDVVANNAGYGLFGAVEEATDAQARAIFDTNVFGVLNVLRATLPVLRRQGFGHILQGSSLYGQTAHPGVGLLAATKYAVEGLTDALVGEVEPFGVKVTLVQPGPTATAFLANLDFAEQIDEYDGTVRAVQEALGKLPAEAFMQPADAAQAIMRVVDCEQPPRRYALGAQAESDMRAALQARLADLQNWSKLGQTADGK
ncbi:SDR family NAD(P)-dependent oxidoreductase [Saccharopolyspora sp. 5N708]|uniref:SDR family NAD(P)-dependent oxidoreductase n=1 Tax=Saccharopolyspora sp. 5N708 TaxID=3457424 RepID=UPI003FD40E73